MLVAPIIVSGLKVAVTRILSSILNLSKVNSLTPTPSPSSKSWSPTGFLSLGQYFTGCSPFIINPLSFNLPICHSTNFL